MSDTTDAPNPSTRKNAASPLLIVDALKAMAGNLPKARASFAKGMFVAGIYTPTTDATNLTRSKNLTEENTVFGRFSVGGGNPAVPDTNGLVLRGFSFRLTTGDVTTDLLTESAPVHFARTLDQMLAFLRARAPAADGKPDPAVVKAFSDANPETLNQARYVAQHGLPASFGATTYWGVHAFPLINAAGQQRAVKLKLVPIAGEEVIDAATAPSLGENFLSDDLEQRLSSGRVEFKLVAILGRPGDDCSDVTARWLDEDTRESVVLGLISLDRIVSADGPDGADATIFDPANLADGIGQPVDEMFGPRSAAYKISLARRTQ